MGQEGKEPGCCPFFHRAVELIGRRWTGAILAVLMQTEEMRFSELAAAVPELSDRLLSERLKELESYGLVERRVDPVNTTRDVGAVEVGDPVLGQIEP